MPSLSPRKAACRPYRADHVRSVRDAIRLVQAIQLPQEVQGGIEQGKDVDLFRFEGKEGQRITMEVFAARYGSALDSLLTLYDGEGRILASRDISGSSDSRFDVALSKTGSTSWA
jgi:hypothetical protein